MIFGSKLKTSNGGSKWVNVQIAKEEDATQMSVCANVIQKLAMPESTDETQVITS